MDPDLLDAVTAWQGGKLPPGRGDALLQRLEHDAEFRADFAAEIWMLSMARVAQAPEPRWLELCERLGIHHESAPDSQSTLESSVMSAVKLRPFRLVQSWWRVAAVGATAVAAVLCFLLLWQKPAASLPTPPPLAQVVLLDSPAWNSEHHFQQGDLLEVVL